MSGKGHFQFPWEGMDLFCNDPMQLAAYSTMNCLLNLTTDFLIFFQVYICGKEWEYASAKPSKLKWCLMKSMVQSVMPSLKSLKLLNYQKYLPSG